MLVLIVRATTRPGHPAAPDDPTPAQAAAGNYPMSRVNFQGLPVTIENERGTIRRGVDRGGTPWAVSMTHHYGYIRGTLGVDGDHLDCFVGPYAEAPDVYIITTMAPPGFGRRDEQKIMLGFLDAFAAREAFATSYTDQRFFGGMTQMPMAEFRRAISDTRRNPRFLVGRPIPVIFGRSKRS